MKKKKILMFFASVVLIITILCINCFASSSSAQGTIKSILPNKELYHNTTDVLLYDFDSCVETTNKTIDWDDKVFNASLKLNLSSNSPTYIDENSSLDFRKYKGKYLTFFIKFDGKVDEGDYLSIFFSPKVGVSDDYYVNVDIKDLKSGWNYVYVKIDCSTYNPERIGITYKSNVSGKYNLIVHLDDMRIIDEIPQTAMEKLTSNYTSVSSALFTFIRDTFNLVVKSPVLLIPFGVITIGAVIGIVRRFTNG